VKHSFKKATETELIWILEFKDTKTPIAAREEWMIYCN